jgi:C2 domain
MFHQGKLLVRPQTAQLAKNKDFLRKQDPYIVMSIGSQQFKTSISKNGGKQPSWTDTINFNINNDQALILHLFDKDKITRDDFIGECTIPLAEVYQRRSLTNWYNIHSKGRLVGQILVSFDFMPEMNQFNQGMQYSGMQQQCYQSPPPIQLQTSFHEEYQTMPAPVLQTSFHEEYHNMMPAPVLQTSFHEQYRTMPIQQTSYISAPLMTSYMPIKYDVMQPTAGYTTSSSYHEEIVRSPRIGRY